MTDRELIVEAINKLFVYTDSQEWEKLVKEVFTENVHLDITSMGGKAEDTTAEAICAMWKSGFEELDAVNHLGGNYLISVSDDLHAEAFAYATATHFKAAATKGKTREFVGSYRLKFIKNHNGWRINSFIYDLKFSHGNLELL